jgi:hypothetical protein
MFRRQSKRKSIPKHQVVLNEVVCMCMRMLICVRAPVTELVAFDTTIVSGGAMRELSLLRQRVLTDMTCADEVDEEREIR